LRIAVGSAPLPGRPVEHRCDGAFQALVGI
jgi:hypothetical protein